MTKRIFNDDGGWTPEGRKLLDKLSVPVKALFTLCAEQGFNEREAKTAIDMETFSTMVQISGTKRRARPAKPEQQS